MDVINKVQKFPFKLSKSAHNSPKQGMCVMEMVSFLQGEEWTDKPKCVCPVIAAFCRGINDRMPQEQRDKLQRYVHRLGGTVSKEHEQERANFLVMKAINVFVAMALYDKGFTEHATCCRKAKTISEASAAAADAAAAAFAADAAYVAAYAAVDIAADADAAADAAYVAAAAASNASNAAANAADAAAAAAGADADIAFAAAAAADAASDAAYAADAAGADVWEEVFNVLDGVLSIGPSGQDFAQEKFAELKAALA